MPLELGIFLGAKRYGDEAQRGKRTLILDIDRYRYQKFISDLAGVDIHPHQGDFSAAIKETREWLRNVSRRQVPSGDKIVRLFADFIDDLPALAATFEFEPAQMPYDDFLQMVVGWLTPDA
jgi:hypothetical protein